MVGGAVHEQARPAAGVRMLASMASDELISNGYGPVMWSGLRILFMAVRLVTYSIEAAVLAEKWARATEEMADWPPKCQTGIYTLT